MDAIIESVLPDKVERVAGSGNKFVHLVEGHSDFYVNLVPGFKNWDMCGSEAILAARFGIVTDSNCSPLIFDEKNLTLLNGIVASKNKRFLEVCLQRIEKSLGYSLSECQKLVTKEALEGKRLRKQET
jgi:3'-phosphoadenosine 5'-phosphosulfate (PAPS) 3'-phosphatase